MSPNFKVLLLLVLGTPVISNAQPELRLEPATIVNGATILFTTDFIDSAPPSSKSDSSIGAMTADERYRITCDLSSTSFAGVIYYTFDAYLNDRAAGMLKHYKITAQPKGPFADTFAKIDFTVIDSFRKSTGTIEQLPVYNLLYTASTPSLELQKKDSPQHVSLLSSVPIKVIVKNKSNQLPIRILDVQTDPTHHDYWKNIASQTKSQFDIQPAPDSRPLEIEAAPQLLPAIMASIFSHDAEHGEETITVSGKYQSLPGGPVHPLEDLQIPVTFVPSGQTLVFFLGLGVIVGVAGIGLLKQPTITTLLKCFGAAVLVAVVVDLIGVGLVQAHSTFTLFGVSLDPVTVQGSFLLGVASGVICVLRSDQLLAFIETKIRLATDRNSGRSVGIVLLILGVISCSPLIATPLPFQPIGVVAGLRTDNLFVLSRDGQVFGVSSEGDHFRLTSVCKVPVIGQMYDLAGVMVNSVESIVTIQLIPATVVTQYSICNVGSSSAATWMSLTGLFNGVTGDSANSGLWVSNGATRDIYRYSDPKAKSLLTTLDDAASITTLAFDASNGFLYAGDPVRGQLFLVRTDSKKSSRLASGVGEIRSIAIDRKNHRVLTVDAAHQKVWSVPDSGLPAKPATVYQFQKNAEPCGIAVQFGRVWVTDCGTKEINAISFAGALIPTEIRATLK